MPAIYCLRMLVLMQLTFNMGLNCTGPLKHRFISINIWSVLCILSLSSADSTNPRLKTVFSITIGSLWMQKAHCMYALFDAILYEGLKHLWVLVSARVLEPIPHRYQGTIEVLGKSKVICGFWTTCRSGPQTSCCSRINCSAHREQFTLS